MPPAPHPPTPMNAMNGFPAGHAMSHDARHAVGFAAFDNKSHPPNEGSMLLELIEQQEFHKVITRIKARPAEAMMTLSGLSGAHNSVMNQGNLALHEACKNQPTVEVIDALLEANEEAIRTKGQWGYLPLHFACASRASPEVVARLIIVFPSATRSKDDHEGTLPLHLAAKWGAADEVIMALLTIHPRASSMRDSSGKTPIDHARGLSSPHVRESVMVALERAPILCAVSKAAMNKIAFESDAKLREVVEIYQERMTQVKDRYEQDKTNAVALEVQLRKELWDEKERAAVLSEKVEQLSQVLEEREMELDAKDHILRQIQGLLLMSQQHQSGQRQQETMEHRASKEQRFSKQYGDSRGQQDNRDGHNSPQQQQQQHQYQQHHQQQQQEQQQEMAKNAIREWVSSGSSENRNDRPNEEANGQGQSSPQAPTTGGPSPRAAAVATVKEWFSSETRRLSDDAEDDSHGVDMPSRDKVESYRQSQTQRPMTPRSNSGHSTLREQNPVSQRLSRDKSQSSSRDSSLLNRSRSVPRQSSVLQRRELNRQSPTQETSRQTGMRNQGPERGESSPREPPSPTPQETSHASRSRSQSYSTSSSRRTQNQGNTGWRKNPSQSTSRRHRESNQSPTTPRETYLPSKPSTPNFTHRAFDDSDSLTMDSQMMADWE